MSNTYRFPGTVSTEREHSVPLDHTHPAGARISLFTREIADPDGRDKPYLVYFQGGPGMEAPRPTSPPVGWMKRALKDYRVLLLDQRGTGRSTPVSSRLPRDSAQAQADYLANFRADSIVRDAELIREELGVERWSILGQSFGGFCSMTYLSIAPHGLREAMITGGLAPIDRPVDDVYAATYAKTMEKNRAYFERYPEDRERARQIFARLETEDVRLPNGDRLTARRFRQMGNWIGFSTGLETLHHLLELPVDSNAFLADVERGAANFARNPIYATLHEACYADGGATRWSAARLLPAEYEAEGWFTAEHIFPWMFEDYGALRPHREAAELLAQREWPRLYDAEVLRHNEVPVAAALYFDDPFVILDFSRETATTIRGLRPWITNEYEHNGIGADPERVFGRLFDLVRGHA